jgi:mannose-1-phosphate guanylyltransferase
LEPVGRNIAPAALQTVNSAVGDDDPVLLVLAADHVIENVQAFKSSVEKHFSLPKMVNW